MIQQDLFDPSRLQNAARHAPAPDRKRLRGQCAAILARLEAGPATCDELQAIARNYTARISNLRDAGYDVPPPEDLGGGLTLYRLGGR